MADDSRNEPIQLRRALAILRRRAWLLVPCLVVATAAAYLMSHAETKRYSATAALLFQQDQISQQLFGFGAANYQDPTTVAATNINLVSQPIVAVNTAHALHQGLTAGQIASEISIVAAGASNVVNVTATDPSPTAAATIANAYAQQFIDYRQTAARAQIVQSIADLQHQIDHLQNISAASSQIPGLQTRLSQLQVLAVIQTGDVQLAEPALVPSGASSPHTKRATALGLVAGLLIGLIAMFLAERIDNTLREPDEVRRLVGLPLLGMIPASKALTRSAAAQPLAPTITAETFRLLRSQLTYFNVDREIKSVLVTSATPGDGKSSVAWNLARTAASLAPESRVLLVDADLRRSSIAEMARLDPAPGLSEILTRGLKVDDVVRNFEVHGSAAGGSAQLHVLTAGALAPNPTELMESQALRRLVEELHASYDFIVFDAPPTAIVSDAIPLTSQVSGVLVVVRLRYTHRDAVKRLREQLVGLGAPTLGLVINDVAVTAAGYKGYAGYAGYTAAAAPIASEPARDVSPHT